VVAHEMGHVRNLDIRTMTVVAALYGGLVLLSDWTTRVLRFGAMSGSSRSSRGGGRDRSGGGGGGLGLILIVVWLLLVVLSPLIGRFMAMAVSRSREYDADATGAELTRNPLGLASALRKIDAATEPTRSVGRGAAHLCIADPMGRAVNNRETVWGDFWGTHPPIRRRISMLESMAGVVSSPSSAPGEGLGPDGAKQAAGVQFGHV
jgi:heat shock protein HtpX